MNRDEFEDWLFVVNGVLAEYDRLTAELEKRRKLAEESAVEFGEQYLKLERERALNAQLLEALKQAQLELRATQINWQEECLFDADQIMTAAIRAAEELK